jgi:hypothetical protein
MKSRTARKIQNIATRPPRVSGNRIHFGPVWNMETLRKSRIICRRKAKDKRVPVVPTEEEWAERMNGIKEFERTCKQLNHQRKRKP